MIDIQELPSGEKRWFFHGSATSAGTLSYSWLKPKNIKIIFAILFGAGGNGGMGGSGAAGTGRYGGGAGANGRISYAFIPAFLCPEILYISVGGLGSETYTMLSVKDERYVDDKYPICWAVAGGPGTDATATVGGLGGTPLSPGPSGSPPHNFAANGFEFAANLNVGGASGGRGGGPFLNRGIVVAAASVGLTGSSSYITSDDGAGGGGACQTGDIGNGGKVSHWGPYNVIEILGGSSTGAVNGNDGHFILRPLRRKGGSGGAGSDAGTGGNGGNGSLSGGGGGGSGAGITAGQKGLGGPGLCILVAK